MEPRLKTCFKCQKAQDVSEYYKHRSMLDGHSNKCKTCTKADIRFNRLNNLSYYQEYDRKRANIPKRIAARKEYALSESAKDIFAKGRKRYIENNPKKRKAHVILGNALRDGRIEKPFACWHCGSAQRVEAHHTDYDNPLGVTWLCNQCHVSVHKEHRERLREHAFLKVNS